MELKKKEVVIKELGKENQVNLTALLKNNGDEQEEETVN